MAQSAPKDKWISGDNYERYVGRWSRPVGEQFLAWLDLPQGLAWLDAGCGTGALTGLIFDRMNPIEVAGIDPSDGFLDVARRTLTDERASFAIASAEAIPHGDGRFDAVVSGLVFNFVPNKPAALSEMRRIARPGGTIAAYVWDYAGRMEMMRHFWDAAVALNPAAAALDEGVRFPECSPEALADLFEAAGLEDVATTAIDVPTVFADFDDYWTPFLSGQAPAPGYCMSLGEAERAALREHIRAALPVEPDGRIRLVGRAWAVRGRSP